MRGEPVESTGDPVPSSATRKNALRAYHLLIKQYGNGPKGSLCRTCKHFEPNAEVWWGHCANMDASMISGSEADGCGLWREREG